MICFRLPGFLLIIGYLFLISCMETPHDSEAVSPVDPEAARIEVELSLMNISQDSRSRNLTIGKSTAHTNMGEAPVRSTRIYERTFILSPIASNPCVLLVGNIRFEACSEIQDYSKDNSPAKQSNDISQNPGLKPD